MFYELPEDEQEIECFIVSDGKIRLVLQALILQIIQNPLIKHSNFWQEKL